MERYKKIIRKRNHADIRQKYSMLLERYEEDKKIYDTADRVICLSEDTQALLVDTYRVEPFKIVRCVNGLKDAKVPEDKLLSDSVPGKDVGKQAGQADGDGFVNVPDDIDEELPFM